MRSRNNPARTDVNLYVDVLCHLRAIQWLAWTAHWTSKGPNAYGMHLLLQRLYSGEGDDAPGPNIEEHIDDLGERIVAYFGNDAINPVTINSRITELLKDASATGPDMVCQLLCLERSLQSAIRAAWDAEQKAANRSLGLDDYLMGLANERDTAIYLLQQVWR